MARKKNNDQTASVAGETYRRELAGFFHAHVVCEAAEREEARRRDELRMATHVVGTAQDDVEEEEQIVASHKATLEEKQGIYEKAMEQKRIAESNYEDARLDVQAKERVFHAAEGRLKAARADMIEAMDRAEASGNIDGEA